MVYTKKPPHFIASAHSIILAECLPLLASGSDPTNVRQEHGKLPAVVDIYALPGIQMLFRRAAW